MAYCMIEGCGYPIRAKGMCSAHYDRNKRLGDPLPDIPVRRKGSAARACRHEGCDSKAQARDLCSTHYKHLRNRDRACSVADCGRTHHMSNFCRSHYKRWKAHGDPLAGPPIRRLTGRTVNREGYVFIRMPDHPNADSSGYVREHALVMSQHLGRPLLPGENVHHINGDKADNRRGNLELWVTVQPSGQRPPDLVRHALAILARYGDNPDDSQRTGGRI